MVYCFFYYVLLIKVSYKVSLKLGSGERNFVFLCDKLENYIVKGMDMGRVEELGLFL